jgi:hypothetical protein
VQREAEIVEIHGYKVDATCLRLPGDLPRDNYKSGHIYRQWYRFPILGYSVLPAIRDEFAGYPLYQWC